jgi:hypothetical protein
MKRFFAIVTVLLLLCTLSACSKKPEEPVPQDIEIVGQQGTITFEPGNRSAGTITLESGSYSFAYDMKGTLTLTYPDGYVYTQTNINGAYGTPPDYDAAEREAKGYPDGLSLAWGIERAKEQDSGRGRGTATPLLALCLLGVGAWNLFAPRSAWWLGWGWRYRNAEPSDLAIGLYRVGGGVLIFMGIICAIAAF